MRFSLPAKALVVAGVLAATTVFTDSAHNTASTTSSFFCYNIAP